MASTSPGYGITIRVEGSPALQPVALITAAITDAGATITALDVVESLLEKVVIDVTCDTVDADHADQITTAIRSPLAMPILRTTSVADPNSPSTRSSSRRGCVTAQEERSSTS